MFAENYLHRFEVKPGRFVYVPSDECKRRGRKIVRLLAEKWTPAAYLYHFTKRGGHVAAMRPHTNKAYKASVDISNFFGCVTRNQVKRALQKVGFSDREAYTIAFDSCVKEGERRHLPYGFVQSMALATLFFERSILGDFIEQLRYGGFNATVYVDDIIISHNDLDLLEMAYTELIRKVETAGFEVAEEKCSEPATETPAFNCEVSEVLKVDDERMRQFQLQLKGASEETRASILRYVTVINEAQAIQLEDDL